MRALTWNLEQVDGESPKGRRQRQMISQRNADVVVLTEASVNVIPDGFHAEASAHMLFVATHARFAIIAAADIKPLPVPELPTAAAAVVNHGGGAWLVVGICMPWRRNAPCLPPDAAPSGANGPEAWLHVLDRLDLALALLRKSHPQLPLLLAGDFNQTLTGRIVGSRDGRDRLRSLLARHALIAFTAASPSASRLPLDRSHLCDSITR